jgi:glycerophosphoryl diester phosphodiesterase
MAKNSDADTRPWRRSSADDPVTILAHRGGSGPWRENTLEAFRGALAAGADGVELDVRRSADGVLVVHHDAEVPGMGLVHTSTRAALPEWVPTLEDALVACAGAAVNVEIKNLPTDPGWDPDHRVSAAVADCLRAGRQGGPWPDRVVVSSFWPDTLAAVGAAAPPGAGDGAEPVALGLLVHPSLDPGDAFETALALGCDALHPFHGQVDATLVARVHDAGMAVVTWTVDEPAELEAVLRSGVDAVITDDVAGTLAHLG